MPINFKTVLRVIVPKVKVKFHWLDKKMKSRVGAWLKVKKMNYGPFVHFPTSLQPACNI